MSTAKQFSRHKSQDGLGRWVSAIGIAAASAVAAACGDKPTDPSEPALSVNADFRLGQLGWTCDAAGYSTANDISTYELVLDFRPLKGTLASQGSAWLLNGRNSIGLVLFCKKLVAGLIPNRPYAVELTAEIATNTSPGCAGVGNAPGEGVLVIGGVGIVDPVPFAQGTEVRVSHGRAWPQDSDVLGNIAMAAKGLCNNSNPWELKTLSSSAFSVVASQSGDVWLLAGITKGFIGPNEVYLTKVKADFR